jgi:hypothetical protein
MGGFFISRNSLTVRNICLKMADQTLYDDTIASRTIWKVERFEETNAVGDKVCSCVYL